MTNRELWEKYSNFTKDLSDNARKLAFVAAGLAWAFKTEVGQFPEPVVFALRSVIIFFIADMLQYLTGALTVRVWTRHQEKVMWKKAKSLEGEYNQPAWLDAPPLFFWWLKIIALLVSYIYLAVYIF